MRPTILACVTAAVLVAAILAYVEHDRHRRVQACAFVADSVSRTRNLDGEELTRLFVAQVSECVIYVRDVHRLRQAGQ